MEKVNLMNLAKIFSQVAGAMRAGANTKTIPLTLNIQ
jgi:hypothetical protein